MKSESLFLSLVVLAVVLISVGFFPVVEPELTRRSSPDGMLTLTGRARQTQPFEIAAGREVKAPLLGLAYAASPSEIGLDADVELFFHKSAAEVILDDLAVYRWQPAFSMWQEVQSPKLESLAGDLGLAVTTRQLGEFALGERLSFEAPVFADVHAELLTMAPPTAVGYETKVGLSLAESELIEVESLSQYGGCDGLLGTGDAESLSRLERKVQLEVNGVMQPTTLVFMTRWSTSSQGGCAAEQTLQPSASRDILLEN